MTQNIDFTALTANPLFYRTYSRYKADGTKESAQEAKDRAIKGLSKFKLWTKEDEELVREYVYKNHTLPSGRWMWVGGTEWVERQSNYIGAYNCSSIPVTNWDAFRLNFRSLLMGCGVGTVVELDKIAQLPIIRYPIVIGGVNELGIDWVEEGARESSSFDAYKLNDDTLGVTYYIGDSKEGWVDVATDLLEFSSLDIKEFKYKNINLYLDLSQVRPAGIQLKGFGGLSNPEKLEDGLKDIVKILNGAVGRQLNTLEVCKILGIHGVVTVAGNLRRSARINQGTPEDKLFAESKDNLWIQENGKWKIDPERDMLRFGNHTLCYHTKPDLETITEAVRKQFYSGEGAIQYVPEAIARANADLLDTKEKKLEFIKCYLQSIRKGANYLLSLKEMESKELEHRINRLGLNPCLSSDTMVLTKTGHYQIKDLVGKTVQIWDGNEWVEVDNFRVTGYNQELFEVELYNGQSIKATDYHRFILSNGLEKYLYELEEGDTLLTHQISMSGEIEEKAAYLKGFAVGDGTASNEHPILNVYEPKWNCLDRLQNSLAELPIIEFKDKFLRREDITFQDDLNHRSPRKRMTGLVIRNDGNLSKYFKEYKTSLPISEILNWTENSKLEFLAGLFDADGNASDTKNGFMYQISSISKQLLLDVQLILISLGVHSKVSLNKPAAKKDFGDGYGEYESKDLYRLTISQQSSVVLAKKINFTRLTSFKDKPVRNQHSYKSSKVKSIKSIGKAEKVYCCTVHTNHQFSLSNGIVIGQCGEIIGTNYLCNLAEVHLNTLDPYDIEQQEEAFKAAALTALPLLTHEFDVEEFRYSRELDPIIGISFTGLFDFFVHRFGEDWLEWWKTGRSREHKMAQYYLDTEAEYLKHWKQKVKETVDEFCERNNINKPNRYTTVQPAGSKSLLTGASPGWHPPKDTRFIRRITYASDSPIAKACADYGYKVIPSQSCKDDEGNLLDDVNDPRVTEVLVEIPIEVLWADIADKANFKPKDISALAQLDFYMQVQTHYVGHNTSGTLELFEHEIDDLSRALDKLIQNDEGYISITLLPRFEALENFPRLPFEPISKEKYLSELVGVEQRRISNDFLFLVNKYSSNQLASEQGPAGCDSDKCLMPERSK